MTQLFFCLPLLAAFTLASEAAPIHFQSAAEQTPLVELYTSEGCSSCPPAESWLSGLKKSPGLWKDFVPVAFHVDYWDYLGWRDPWSARQFSDRQRDYSASWRTESVYTPGMVLNGQEWGDWMKGKSQLKPSTEKVGALYVYSVDTNRWQIKFMPAVRDGTHYEVHGALLGSGLISDVKGGENRGRRLTHDFAVLKLADTRLNHTDDGWQGEIVLPVAYGAGGGDLAIAVWVTRVGQLQPLQATGGWLSPASGQ